VSIWSLIAALAAGVLAVLGSATLFRDDVSRVTVRVDGVPMTVVRPSTVEGNAPGVVVAHGFAGSGRLMQGFADTLVRHGYVVVLLDFAGHGASTRWLPEEDPTPVLRRDLGVAVGYLRGLSTVDPTRIGLVGHSMGAAAVVDYAAGDPGIGATVAISLGRLDGAPANLLIVYGALEFPAFRDTAERAVADGRAQRAVAVSGTEHITVLFADRTHQAMAEWLDPRLGGRPDGVRPRDRLLPAGLLLLAFAIGLYPVALLLLGRQHRVARAPLRDLRFVPALVLGLAAALFAGRLFGFLPIAVGDYQAGFFLVLGLVLSAAAYQGRPLGTAPWWSLLLIVYAASAVAIPIHFGLTSAWPVGDRWWLLPVLALCCFVFLLGTELATGGLVGRHAVVLLLAVLMLLGGAVLGVAPGFVLLIAPLLVVLLSWQAAWAVILRRCGAPPWLIAAVGAVLLAWPVATALPLSSG
jgi:dienelactone hydrolase